MSHRELTSKEKRALHKENAERAGRYLVTMYGHRWGLRVVKMGFDPDVVSIVLDTLYEDGVDEAFEVLSKLLSKEALWAFLKDMVTQVEVNSSGEVKRTWGYGE